MDNRETYFSRMTQNFSKGTKALLPLFPVAGSVLDVGVGSGELGNLLKETNKNVKLIGIDKRLEIEAKDHGYDLLIEDDFFNLNSYNKHNAIYFSSVMHEIGSYNETSPGSFKPIYRALQKANKMLTMNGTIIIRDGLAEEKNIRDTLTWVTFKDIPTFKNFRKFRSNFKVISSDFTMWNNLEQFSEWDKTNALETRMPEWALKEFLATYTWGQASIAREIQERYGYMSASEWRAALEKTGFEITFEIHSPESYEKHCGDWVKEYFNSELNKNHFTFPDMTITIMAKKVKEVNY